MRKLTLHIIIALIAGIFFYSCKKRNEERPRWDTEIIAPLIKTSLSINDFLPDSSVSSNSDNSMSLVYREPLYSFGLDSLVGLKVKPFERKKSVESLVLGPDTIEYAITLGMIARQMKEDGDPAGDFILNNHGNLMPVPSLEDLSANPMYIDISNLIVNAKINSGGIKLFLDNGFPVALKNVEIGVSNYYSGAILIQESIPSLPGGSVHESEEFDLSGKEVESVLQVDISNFDIGGGFVRIDTNDAVIARFVISELTVEEATAMFPAQNVVDEKQNTALEDMGDVKLTKAILKAGKIKMDASTTAQDTIYFTYSIPGATFNGVPFLASGFIPPATPGVPTSKTFEYDFTGYHVDLTGENHDTINCIYNHLTARIEETGEPVYISRSDYVDVTLTFEGIEPRYIEGFLGTDAIDIGPGEVFFDVFDEIIADRLDFKDVIISMDVENGLGATGSIEIDYLTASNSSESKTITSPVVGTVQKALANPLQTQTTTLPVNETNVRPVELLNIEPDKIEYSGKAFMNKGVSATDYSGFAYDNSSLDAYLNLELPLDLIAESLTLTDTVDFASAVLNESITEGVISILAWNGYPLDASLEISFYNKEMQLIDSLVTGREILAASLDPESGKVQEKKYSKASFTLNSDELTKVLQASKVVFEVKFWTSPSEQHVKIYNDYNIDLKLAGDFNYTVMTK